MSKRYKPLQFNTSINAKRPKLDVESYGASVHYNTGVRVQAVVPTVHTIQDDIWGDDEDDDLIINVASQVERNLPVPGVGSQFLTSFTEFEKGAQPKSSTQFSPPRPLPKPKPAPPVPNNLWPDDDDDDLLLSQFDLEANVKLLQEQKDAARDAKPGPSNEFKIPEIPKQHCMDTSVILPSQMTISEEARKKLQERKEKAAEAKIRFFQQRLEKLENEKKKNEEDLKNSSDKLQLKENEIIYLKYEVKQAKQLSERLKQDKIRESENVKKDTYERMNELENKAQLLQAELDTKNAEITSIKNKHALLNKSNASILIKDTEKPKLDASKLYQLLETRNCYNPNICKIDDHIFESITLNRHSDFDVPTTDFITLQQALASLQIQKTLPKRMEDHLKVTMFEILDHLMSYTYGLRKITNEMFETSVVVEQNFLSQANQKYNLIVCPIHVKGKISLAGDVMLSTNEILIVARRSLIGIAELCHFEKFVIYLKETVEDKPLLTKMLHKLSTIVLHISRSEAFVEHAFLVAAIVKILTNLIQTIPSVTETHRVEIAQIMSRVIRCRLLNLTFLYQISEFLCVKSLQNIPENNEHFLSSLCYQSPNSIRCRDDNPGILRFTAQACPLQIFGILLETCVKNNLPIDLAKSKVFCALTVNIARWLINLIRFQRVRWIENAERGRCSCLGNIIAGFIIICDICLFTQVMQIKKIGDEIKTISKLAVQIFGVIYNHTLDIFKNWTISSTDVKAKFYRAVNILKSHTLKLDLDSSYVTMLDKLDVPKILMDFTIDSDIDDDDVMIVEDSSVDPIDSLNSYCYDRNKENR